MKLKSILIPLFLSLGLGAQTKSFSVDPSYGNANESLSVTITGGEGTRLGLQGTCTGSNCVDIGSMFYFTAGTSTISVPYNSVSLVDSNHAVVDILVPYSTGSWNVTLPSQGGLAATNSFQVLAPRTPSFALSHAYTTEGTPFTTVLSGTYLTFNALGSCSTAHCKPIGDAIAYQGYTSQGYVNGVFNLTEKTFIDSNHVQITFTAPPKGSYYLLLDGISADNAIISAEDVSLRKYFTLTPDEGESDEELTVTITGTNVNLGYNGSCTGTNCRDLGSFFYFSSGSTTITVPYSAVSLLDSNSAQVTVTPPYAGTWTLSTESRLYASNYLKVNAQPQKSFSISPASGSEGEELLVTITGNNTTWGYQGSCSGKRCTDIGTSLSYFTQGSPTVSGTLFYNSVQILDSNHIQVGITLPQAGLYGMSISGLYTQDLLTVSPASAAKAVLSGSQTICKDNFADLSISLSGQAPWTIIYTNKKTRTKVSNIYSSPYTISVSPSASETYILTQVIDGTGQEGEVEGTATIKIKKEGSVSATLSRSTAPKHKNTKTLRLDLKGSSPWTVTMQVDGQDTLVENIQSSPHFITVSKTSTSTYTLFSVVDADACGLGAVSGTVSFGAQQLILLEGMGTELRAEALLYPNPAKDIVHVAKGARTKVLNLQGLEVLSTTQQTFDVSQLTSGIYTVHITQQNGEVVVEKLVKE